MVPPQIPSDATVSGAPPIIVEAAAKHSGSVPPVPPVLTAAATTEAAAQVVGLQSPEPQPAGELSHVGAEAKGSAAFVASSPPWMASVGSEPAPASPGATPLGSTEASPPSRLPTAGPPPPPQAGAEMARDSRKPRSTFWSVVCHLSLFLTIPTFFLGAVATFLVWQIGGKDDPHIEDQGREALNFQINVAILTLLLGASCLGWPLLALTWVLAAIYCLIAASHAGQGENYRYPWILRIVTH